MKKLLILTIVSLLSTVLISCGGGSSSSGSDNSIPATPSSLTATASSGTVNLSWNSIAEASYKVYQSTSSIGDDLSSYQSYEASTSSIEITGLRNGTSYYFVVTALANGKESLASDEVDVLPDFPIPPAPTSLTVTSESSGTVNLSWNSVAGATYKVYQSTGSIGDDLSSYTSYNVTTSSTEITGLRNGTSYYFVITALENGKESPASDEVSGFPDFSIPPVPTSLTVTSESSGTVNLSWNSVAGATYKVYQEEYQSTGTPFSDDLSSYQSYEATTSSTEITGLRNGTSYYFVVTALANGKESAASNEVSGLPDFPIPPAPMNLTVTPSSGTVSLSWDSVAGATYKVYQSTSGSIADDLSSYQSYEVTTSSTEITGLTNGTSYYFVVTALVNGKVSPASDEVNGLPEFPVPSTPTNLTVNASSGTVNLSWTGSEGAHYYKVYQSTAMIIADDLSSYTSYNVTANTKEITGLTNNTTYYFVVTAVIGDKESPASDEVSGLPEFPQPSTPTKLSATASSGTVNLSWTGSAGAHYYKVYQSTGTIIAADLSSYTSYNVTVTSKEIPGLANGTTYYFVVIAVIGDKESGISDEVSGLPEENLIAPPTNLMVTASSGTVNLNWTGRARATYTVHQATSSFFNVADYTILAGYTSSHVTETSKEITGLTNGDSYYFVVTALVGSKESGVSNEVIGNPDFPIPSTPTSLEVTSVSSGTVNLSWNSVAGASYKVYQSTVTPFSDDLSSYTSYNVSTTSTEITGLTNGTLYYFVVTALANGKESLASDEVIGNPDFPIPLVPTSLTVTSESSGTVNLSWNSVAGATYRVYQSTATIGDDLSSYTSYNVSTSSTEITELTNGTSYYFVVTALANGKVSPVSNEITALPDFPIPATPTGLVVTSASSGTVNLSWTGNDGATYKVHQATSSFFGVADYENLVGYISYDVIETSTKITELRNGTRYYFVVTALANGKVSPVSKEVTVFPDSPIPPAPTSLTVTSELSSTGGIVSLSWNSVAGATYKVYQAIGAISNDLSSYTPYNVSTSSAEITGLTNGVIYTFVVTAFANGKESPVSNVVIGEPDFSETPVPKNLIASASSGTVNLSWNNIAGVTYTVYQSTVSIGSDLSSYISRNVSSNSITIRGLMNGTSYYFVVTALANGKESLASKEAIGRPDFLIPPTPTGLVATPSSQVVSLRWTGSDKASSYEVHQAESSFNGINDYSQLPGYTFYNTTTTSRLVTGLVNGTIYYFVITALANGKESPASNEAIGLPDFPIPATPTNLIASASSGTVNLSWTGSDGAHYYKVYQSTGTIISDDLSSYQSYNITETSTKITGLTNNTSYYFVVTALANGKESPASNEISGFPEFPVPSTPTNLRASASSGTVNLSWTGSEGAHYYKVYQSTAMIIADDLSSYTSYNVTANTKEITGLTNNTTYYFVVTAVIGDKESPASDEVSGLPEFPQPSTPTKLSATASSGTVNLSWTGSAGAHYYKVYQSTGTIIADDLSSYSSYNVSLSSTAITGLMNGTSYYFVVTALANGKESPASNEAIGLPDFPIPATPTNLIASASSGTVNLSWTGSDGAHNYKVYQSTGTIISDDLLSYQSYNITETSTKITGLTNNTSYYFVVTALANGKESPASNEAIGLPEFPVPSMPTTLTVTSESSGTVNLSWTGSDGAHYYKVYQSTGTIISDDLSSYQPYIIAETSTNITGLVNGTSYYFVVTAVIGDKESGVSNEAIGLPDFSIPATPTGLMAISSSGTVNLSWNSVDVAGASYKVYQSTATIIAADLSSYSSYNVSLSSTAITGLTNGTSYYFVVTALANGKESPASNEAIGLPDFPIPATPTTLIASASSGTVNLSWTGSDGAHYYKVYQSTGTIISDDLLSYQSYNIAETSTKITGLTNNTSYYFVVTAVIGDKESGVSNEAIGLPDFSIPATPTGLMAISSSGTVNLSWNSVDVAGASYKVYQSTGTIISDDLLSYQSYNITETSTKITGLTNNTSYYFVVTALANGKESPASNEAIGLPEFPVPSMPTTLTVTSESSGTVNLSWTGSDGAHYYKVYQSTGTIISDDLSSYQPYIIAETSTNITGLVNGTSYYFVVTALANGKESPASNEAIGLPEFPVPSMPTTLTVTSESSGTVNLSWTGSDGAHYYKVYQSTGTIISDDLSSYQPYIIAETSTNITGLVNGTSYYFVVTAVIGDKESGVSNEAIGLPDFSIPATPTGLMAISSSGTVNLSWNSVDVAGASYKVYQSTATIIADDLSSYSSYNVSLSSTAITGLMNGTSYYFVVTALANGKESPASNEVDGLPDFPIPATPTNLIASASSGTVNLSWTGSDGAHNYKVYQSTGTIISDDLLSYQSYNIAETSTKITGLTNNTSYYFVVTALANGKESPASNEAIGLPEFPVPSMPTTLTVTSESSGTVNLSWTGSDGAYYYKVYQSTGTIISDDLSSYQPYIIAETSTNITGLVNGTSYYFVVTAVIGDKESGVSNEAIGLPDFSIPATPTGLMAISSSGTVNLSWNSVDVAGATYKVYQSTATIIADDLSSYTSYNVSLSSTAITGLVNGTSYYFVVTALANGKESLASNEAIGLPDFPVPATPTNLMAMISSGTADLSWDSVVGATYKVYQSTATIIADDLSSYTSYNVSVSSTAITGLTNGRTYYFVVTALANGKESPASNEIIGNPDFPIPPIPTNLMAMISSGTVNLSWWSNIAGATYKVYQSTATIIADDLSSYTSYDVPTTTSRVITGLTNGTRYYFVVTALANGKESPASKEVSGRPDFSIPAMPMGLMAISSSGTVNLSWNSVDVAGATYKVYQSSATIGDDLSSYTSYNVSVSSTAITGLTNGTSYYFVVTALANGKESPASNEIIGNPDFPTPAKPMNLMASESSGTANLSWDSVAGVTYKVYQSSATIIADDLSSYSSYNVSVSSTAITGLMNGTRYYFVVTALANGKESPASDEVNALPDFPIPEKPTNLMASESSGTANLSWDSVAGASYKVYQSTGTIIADDLSSYTSYNVSVSSTAITGLTNGVTYYFVVTALANGKESPASDEVNALPDFPIPEKPTNLMASESSGTANLSWDSVAGASYKVYQSTGTIIADDLSSYISYNVSVSSTAITGLINGTRYYFVVIVLANGKESGVSNEVNALPDFPIPEKPTGLVMTSESSGTVNLSWNSVAGASYKVYQSTGSIGEDLSSYTSYNVSVSSTAITGLINGTRYYFVVTALANDKESPASDEVNALPDFPIPEKPTNLMASASSGTVNLSWSSVVGASYKVYQSTATIIADDLSSYRSYNVSVSSTAITGLMNGTTYYFVVTALANGKESPASDEVNELPDFSIPATPTNLVAITSSGTANLSWNGVAGATYKVYQSTATIIADDLSSYTSYNVSVSSTAITGLTNGTSYYFVVTALANGKESPASNEIIGYPDFPTPLPPTNLRATPSSGTVNLSWNSVAGATYKVYQSTGTIMTDDLSSYTSYNVETSAKEITELTNGVTYYFVVTALANGKESPASNEVSGLPEESLIAPPTNLMVTNVSSGTVSLNWTGRDGATYKVYQSTGTIIGGDLSSYTSYNVMTTSRVITDLTNGTSYYFVVTAVIGNKESGVSNEVIELPDFPIPSMPTSLMVTSISSGTVNLSWNSVAGASYRVYQSTGTIIADDLSSYQSSEATTSSIEITGLSNGTTYYFVVTALANGKESGISNEVSGFPDYPIPSEPTNLTVTSISSGAVYLSWTGSDGETYNVHQATQAFNTVVDYGDLADYQLTEVTTTSIKIAELTNDITYYFVVTALANGKESVASDEVSATPFAPRPLNDTGITWGGNFPFDPETETMIPDCSPYAFEDAKGQRHPGTDYDFAAGTEQDCHQGRDAEAAAGTLDKIGGGNAGFDFTKLGSTGTVLSIQDAAWSDSGSENLGTKWSCVRDNVTGAVWEVKLNDNTSIHDTSRTYEYEDTTWTALVDDSNQEELCGYNDWRVPTIIELDSIIDLGDSTSTSTSTYDTNYFPNSVNNEAFWSSSLDAGNSNKAWTVLSAHRATVSVERSSSTVHHLRLIRSSFTMLNQWPDYRYTDHGDGTVTDNVTGLMWAKCSFGQSGDDCGGSATINWKDALEEASSSTLATYTDWRLPNRKELHSLVAYDRIEESINSNRFPNTQANHYWTSSPRSPRMPVLDDLDAASWAVTFRSGADYYGRANFRAGPLFMRLVRSSQ